VKLNPWRNDVHEQTYTNEITFNCLHYDVREKHVKNFLKSLKIIVINFEKFIPLQPPPILLPLSLPFPSLVVTTSCQFALLPHISRNEIYRQVATLDTESTLWKRAPCGGATHVNKLKQITFIHTQLHQKKT
jgi:hypothetical protein